MGTDWYVLETQGEGGTCSAQEVKYVSVDTQTSQSVQMAQQHCRDRQHPPYCTKGSSTA